VFVRLEDGRFREIGQLALDPVCGMSVETDNAVTIAYAGRTFSFCSSGCRSEFERAPERFAQPRAATPCA
jgi:YHS domain-containing protein